MRQSPTGSPTKLEWVDGVLAPEGTASPHQRRAKARSDIRASGYVAHTLEAALWSVGRTSDYRSAVLMAANLGEDADTTAAVAGQLAGALYGASQIPANWVSQLAWRERIIEIASSLLAAA